MPSPHRNGTTDQIRLLDAEDRSAEKRIEEAAKRIDPVYKLAGMGIGALLALVAIVTGFLQMRDALAAIAPIKADVAELKDWKRDTSRDLRWMVRALDAETRSHGVTGIGPAPVHEDDPPPVQSTW